MTQNFISFIKYMIFISVAGWSILTWIGVFVVGLHFILSLFGTFVSIFLGVPFFAFCICLYSVLVDIIVGLYEKLGLNE